MSVGLVGLVMDKRGVGPLLVGCRGVGVVVVSDGVVVDAVGLVMLLFEITPFEEVCLGSSWRQ